MQTTWSLRRPPVAANPSHLGPRVDATIDPAPAEVIAELTAAGHPPELATLLARRGVADPIAAAAFLSPAIADLHDPLRLAGMAEALGLLLAARERGESVAVVGDYDVDGLTATALLLSVFRATGLQAHGILPNRHAGGYGMQPQHVARAQELGCRLIVTADCGIQSHAAIADATARGLQVIVTDHHLPGDRPLGAAAVINPHQAGCSYPFRELAGVGLALKLAVALLARLGREIPWDALCRISCLGTIADAAPLVGENRVLASRGLAALSASPSVGLQALLAESEVGQPVSAHDVGFRIGPRLNAAGRLGAADPALELLLTRDPAHARALARQLGALNTERRALEKLVVDDCATRFAGDALPALLVGWSPAWHRGVLGIAAGRLARLFHRPALLFAVEDGLAVGSGRSVPGLDLHAFLRGWEARLERFGGHAQAVGLTADAAAIGVLAAEWEAAAALWPAEGLARDLEYDQDLALSRVTPELLATLARLEPFGVGNPEPVFRFGSCRRAGLPRFFGTGHLGFNATATEGADGAAIEVVAWQGAERAPEIEGSFDLLAVPEVDRYRNRPRLRLVDLRPATAAGKSFDK